MHTNFKLAATLLKEVCWEFIGLYFSLSQCFLNIWIIRVLRSGKTCTLVSLLIETYLRAPHLSQMITRSQVVSAVSSLTVHWGILSFSFKSLSIHTILGKKKKVKRKLLDVLVQTPVTWNLRHKNLIIILKTWGVRVQHKNCGKLSFKAKQASIEI